MPRDVPAEFKANIAFNATEASRLKDAGSCDREEKRRLADGGAEKKELGY